MITKRSEIIHVFIFNKECDSASNVQPTFPDDYRQTVLQLEGITLHRKEMIH